MTDVVWNPGEPLFDQATADFVEVEGDVVMPEDDAEAITNAAWYRVMTQRGDCPRDRDAGIDRGLELFNPELPVTAGLGSVRQEIADTPGVSSVQTIEVQGYDADQRALFVSFTADTIPGDTVSSVANLQG